MNIFIIGAGHVGGTLGTRLVEKGHSVFFGVRHPEDPVYQDMISSLGDKACIGTVSEGVNFSDVVILATPWGQTRQAIFEADRLKRKIVIDCTNPFSKDYSTLTLGRNNSAAEKVAMWARGAKVAKAFNHEGYNIIANPRFDGAGAVTFICGHDEAKQVAIELAREIGFEPIDAGPLRMARTLEPLALLWVYLATHSDMGRNFAFGILKKEAGQIIESGQGQQQLQEAGAR